MQADVKNLKGETVRTMELPAGIFEAPINIDLMHQAYVRQMANARLGTHSTLRRGEVSGGGKKPWKQKGTGRARAGTIRSPLWRHGGRHFAAVPRDHSQKVNRKMYRGAIRSILGELNRQGHLIVVEKFAIEASKTKSLLAQLEKIGSNDLLIVTESVDKNLMLSSRNLRSVEVCDVEALNPVSLLSYEKVLVTQDAVKKLEAWLS
jgi:large subunit ribosomal protein L4